MEPRKHACQQCGAVEDHPVHGMGAKRGSVATLFGRRVVAFGREVFYLHDYDPGERRRGGERRRLGTRNG